MSTTPEIHGRLMRLTAHTLWLTTALTLAGCDALNYVEGVFGMHEKAMHCMASNPTEMNDLLRDIRREPVYLVNKAKVVGVVHFELEIPGLYVANENETLMFLSSNKVGAMIFSGPFQPKFSIEVDERLTEDGPGDSLEFRMYRVKHNQICVQTKQVGDPIWQPGSTVKVRFLRERYMDKTTGTPIGFEMDITKH